MDNSKLPNLTKKSSETPWSPTHERKKLKDRAGSTGEDEGSSVVPPIGIGLLFQGVKVGGGKQRSWKKGEKVTEENFDEGKYPGTDKPAKHWKNRRWRWQDKTKGKDEESEY